MCTVMNHPRLSLPNRRRGFVKRLLSGIAVAAGLLATAPAVAGPMGPLKVHPTNPRYFADGNGNAVYLTGSHTWNSMSEMTSDAYPVIFNYTQYLNFLEANNHNFIRLWRREMPKFKYGNEPYRYSYPHPWKRTGPGNAGDGQPKFDLNQFDQGYFDRLRARCIEAQNRNIYVCIMLFEGHDLQFTSDGWFSHPFKLSNNVNNINGDTNNDGRGLETQTTQIAAVLNLQRAYIRKVIDTVNDLDNVMYEISNESHGGSEAWQNSHINYINQYQAGKPRQHPIMFSTMSSNNAAALWSSNAQAVSPGTTANDEPEDMQYEGEPLPGGPPNGEGGGNGNEGEGEGEGDDEGEGDLPTGLPGDPQPISSNPYRDNPPANDGAKIVINDTDHLYGCAGERAWVWKSALRGLYPIHMDTYYADSPWCHPPNAQVQKNLGYARTYVNKLNLNTAQPRNSFASTGYCLHDGSRYLVFLPGGGSVTVNMGANSGNYIAEWLNPWDGHVQIGAAVTGGGNRNFTDPFGGDSVLLLRPDGGGGGGGGGGGPAPAPPAPPVPPANFSGGSGDQFGRVVAKAGDVNNDGRMDLIIGVPYSNVRGTNSGEVFVMTYRPSDGQWITRWNFKGQKPGDRFGWSVSTAGDVNNDGFDDVIIGAPYNDTAGSNAGRAYIYSGKNGKLLKARNGARKGDRYGWSVAGGIDVNRDGKDDVIISAPWHDDRYTNSGAVYVYAGGTYSQLKKLRGQKTGDLYGYAVAGLGRVDADGYDDFIVGAPMNDDGGTNAGKIYVYSGKKFNLLYSRKGSKAREEFGFSVAALGRADTDARADFIVGAPYHDVGGLREVGRVAMYSGASGQRLWQDFGLMAADRFGWTVASAGDVDGDGRPDVVVGAPWRSLDTSTRGRVEVLSGDTGFWRGHFDGEAGGEQFGMSVTNVGDIDGDGRVDLVIGAPKSNVSGSNSGRVIVLPRP